MKKLYLLLLMFSIFALPSMTTQAALTPPTLWDYAFIHDGTNFVFSDGTNTYTPEFTQTANGVDFDYQYVGDANGLLPFEIDFIFYRSNSTWTLGTTGYIATATAIGSNFNFEPKYLLTYDIQNNNDFYLILDNSSSSSGSTDWLNVVYRNIAINTYSTTLTRTQSTQFKSFILPSYMVLSLNTTSNSSASRYVDAMYFVDLGTSLAVQTTTGYQSGYDDGFGDGYLTGVAEDNAYAIGYAKGLIDGGDMETGSSILIFVVAAIGFIMMIFGFTTRRGIFNLLSVGAFIVLGAMLAQYIGFIIIAIGLVIINVYYAFWGDL